MKIRRLEDEDVDGISELWQEFAALREGMTGTQILNEDAADYFFGYATGLLQRKDTLTLVAEEGDGDLVGYLIASKQRKPPIYQHTRVAYLSDAFVVEDARGKGILKEFVDKLMAWCEAEGITAVDVMLFRENELAQDIYEKMGFKPYRVVMRREIGEE